MGLPLDVKIKDIAALHQMVNRLCKSLDKFSEAATRLTEVIKNKKVI